MTAVMRCSGYIGGYFWVFWYFLQLRCCWYRVNLCRDVERWWCTRCLRGTCCWDWGKRRAFAWRSGRLLCTCMRWLCSIKIIISNRLILRQRSKQIVSLFYSFLLIFLTTIRKQAPLASLSAEKLEVGTLKQIFSMLRENISIILRES